MLMAIDPGTTESAYVMMIDGHPVEFAKIDNYRMLELVEKWHGRLFIEQFKSYGNPVGDSVFNACIWMGRFIQVYDSGAVLVPRKTYASTFCKGISSDAKIKAAMCKLFNEPQSPKRPVGQLKGMTGDVWQALALAVYAERKIKTMEDMR